MASARVARQSIEITNGKWYSIVIGLTSAADNIDFAEIGSLTVRLGQTSKALTALTSYGKRYLLMQATVNSDSDKFIEIEASTDLVNATLIMNDANQVAVSVRECSDTNLVSNGTFTGNADGWTLGTGWTYGSNKITHSGSSGSATQAITATTGNDYVIYLESTFTSLTGSLSASFGGGSYGSITESLTETVEVPIIIENISSSHTLTITSNISDNSVDNVVIREITGSNLISNSSWDLGTGWKEAGDVAAFTYYSASGDIIKQTIGAITVGLTYRISFDIDGFFENGVVKVSFVSGTGKEITVSTGHASFDLVATTTTLQFELITYQIAGYVDVTSNVTYLSIDNVSLKLNTDGALGSELVTNGSFTGGLTGWTNSAGIPRIVHGDGLLVYKPFNDGELPDYSPSIITAVKNVQQNVPSTRFIIAGRGGVNQADYTLFKKSDTYNFTIWRSQVYKIAGGFDVMSIEFGIVGGITGNKEIIPVLRFDDERDESVGTKINITNYPNSEKLIRLTSKNFNNTVAGESNFYLELQNTGRDLAVVSMPIIIEIE